MNNFKIEQLEPRLLMAAVK
ncbi:LEPR-XLL domain-containing protein [Fibrobacter sp. UWR3]